MSTHELLDLHNLTATDTLRVSACFIALYAFYTFASAFYVAFLGPLRKYPGPPLRALSEYPLLLSLWRGEEARDYVALHAKYGPVVRVAPNKLSYAAGAQAHKDIYGFRKAGQPNVNKDPFFYVKPFNGVSSLIVANDANHTRQRKLISHSFADKTLKELEPLLKHWVEKMKNKLHERMLAGDKVDILKMYNCTTFDIMGDLSFGEGLDMLENGEYSSWVKAIFGGIKQGARLRSFKGINSITEWIVTNFVMSNQKVRVKQAEHWNYSKERVDRRLARTPERPDLWTKILEKSKGPGGLSVDEHHSTASLFMVAGTETTATALSGVTYYLLQNPEYLHKLSTEIRNAHNTFEDITLDSIQHLKYLHAVLQEGLRMYPPVPSLMPRTAPEALVVCGQPVPAGTTIGVAHLATYRSEEHFKDPYEFRPERWLGDPDYKDDHLDSVEPFSVGPRNCLGKNLAWHEMRLILAATLFSFDLQLCEESNDWNDQKTYLLWEKKPLIVKLSPPQS